MPTESQWRALADQIDGTVGRWSVTLMSSERSIVLEARKQFPGVETALVHGAGYLSPAQIHAYGDSYVQSVGSITSSRAGLWHTAGLTLYAWTVDDPADWEKLAAWPVDVVITNKPIAYEEWAASRCRGVMPDR
jgi:glycerophosphoryl diester phosphodiesterase